jgi:hypothetical protein
MNGHLRRCRFGIPPHVRPSTLRGDCTGRAAARPVQYCQGPTMSALCALHLTIPEQAPMMRSYRTVWILLTACLTT